MASRKILLVLILTVLSTLGCQGARQNPAAITVGRLGPGAAGGANRTLGANKQWGIITNTGGDQAFAQALSYFTYPQLSANGDAAVGYVSSQPNQSTGVFFTGNAQSAQGSLMNASYGYVNLTNVQLEIDIYDDKVAQFGAISHPFTSGSGSIQGGYVTLNFQDSTTLVTMYGSIQGQMFSGEVYFANTDTGGQTADMGQFTVPLCGFFVCQ